LVALIIVGLTALLVAADGQNAPALGASPRAQGASVNVLAVEIDSTSRRAHGSGGQDWSLLQNKSFVAVSLRDRNGPKPPISRPRSLEISFTLVGLLHPALSWQANCNFYSYRLRAASRRLVTSHEINTQMFCLGRPSREVRRPSREDAWLDDFFRSNPRWRLSHGHLKLVAGNRVVRLQQRST
jgi:hypothetical protein